MIDMSGVFVTGTDTDVGKTVVSSALMHRLRQHVPVRYWKPIQTGIEDSDDTATVARLGACTDDELVRTGIRLPRPVSPHLAARISRTTIRLPSLLETAHTAAAGRIWVVEGAGGVLVPINDEQTMVDLMAALQLPVVVAARSTLGTINHTLLTLQALRLRQLQIAGVVMVGDRNADNRAAIEQYGSVAVLGELPRLSPLDAGSLERWSLSQLDTEGTLLELHTDRDAQS
jgi:dethiobiotin synthase